MSIKWILSMFLIWNRNEVPRLQDVLEELKYFAVLSGIYLDNI